VTTLLLVGHGSTRGTGAAQLLARHAATLAARGCFADVRTATLAGAPSIIDAVRDLATPELCVVPMFMCAGHFVTVELPRALAAALPDPARGPRVEICPPLGEAALIADVVAGRAVAGLREVGVNPGAATLLLAAHGSPRDPASRRATEAQVARLQAAARFRAVVAGYLEEPPTLADVLPALPAPAVVAGLFTGGGRHAHRDVTAALTKAGRTDIIDLGPVGVDPAIPDIVLAIVESHRRAAARGGVGVVRDPG
jgi:sirohydrochlorin cobaltochelatase